MEKINLGQKLFDRTVGVVNQSLDVRNDRHKVISGNIANADTPNYVPKEIPFQKILEPSVENPSQIPLQKTHPQHFPEPAGSTGAREWTTEIETPPNADGVNIDQEMAKLAENNLMFQAGIHSLMKKFEALKVTIGEGR